MKIFAIRDENDTTNKILAVLYYYEKAKKFFIELPDNADPWETPLILSSFAKRGLKRIGAYYSKLWVQQRIVPTDRQNLGQILKENGLECYDEFELLMLADGRCAQDDYYLEPISEDALPEEFISRQAYKVEDAISLGNGILLVFFKNGETKKCNICELWKEMPEYTVILEREELFDSVGVQVGGNGVYWDEKISISDEILYQTGESIPLSIGDFCKFIDTKLVNTSQATELLGCSRQNIDDLVKRGKLNPVKVDAKNKLFLKSEIMQRNWN